MSLDSSAAKLIEKLTWETISGKVEWSFDNPPEQLTSGTSDIISTYIRCKYKDRQHMAVFERRYKYYSDEDTWSWSATRVFVMMDNWGRVIFESDSEISINNLFDVAKNNASGIDGIIKSLIED